MINRILHSWSVNMKFMKLVKFRYFVRRRLAKYRNYTTRFINFILNDHSCKILYLANSEDPDQTPRSATKNVTLGL